MLALLVQATCGEANLVFANPGDWGIDVLVGDLRGQVTIWQAKYFVRGFNETQQNQVRDSFKAALKAARRHGYQVVRWILCLPSSMDGPATQWWQGWKARQQDSGVRIELWDETRLRALLISPEAAYVRRHYYNPYRHDDAAGEPAQLAEPVPAPAAGGPEPEAAWVGGAEYRLADSLYLLHDEPSERTSRDLSWVWREATADLIEPGEGRVRLRQVRVLRRLPAAEQQQAGLRAQAGLLARLAGRAGLPRLLETCAEQDRVAVVTAHPPGWPWAEVTGPARGRRTGSPPRASSPPPRTCVRPLARCTSTGPATVRCTRTPFSSTVTGAWSATPGSPPYHRSRAKEIRRTGPRSRNARRTPPAPAPTSTSSRRSSITR